MNKSKYKMGFVVKNTTFFGPLDLICPYSCRGCGRLGEILCGRCKKYFCGRENMDVIRRKLVAEEYDELWGYGVREGMLDELVKEYKYGPVRGIGVVLAELLDEVIPCWLDENVIIVPLPTIEKHIRDRGFDHMLYMAKKLARRRGWKYEKMLVRVNSAVQVGATQEERLRQAEGAYGLKKGRIETEKSYLLIDDVWTTGASMRAAAEILRAAGVKKIYGAVVAVSGKM